MKIIIIKNYKLIFNDSKYIFDNNSKVSYFVGGFIEYIGKKARNGQQFIVYDYTGKRAYDYPLAVPKYLDEKIEKIGIAIIKEAMKK